MRADLPLSSLRVVDATAGPARYVGKLLAELGATVVLVDPENAKAEPAADMVADRYKRRVPVTATLAPGDLVAEADILIAGRGRFFSDRSSAEEFARLHPRLVVLSVTDFGLGGTFQNWTGSEAVYQALGGQLSRSGLPGKAPLLAPGDIATQSSITQAAFLVLLAYLQTLRTGCGDLLDFALAEGAAQALDPGFGIQGSATSGIPASKLPQGRPEARFQYPILPCRDGYVRICVLSPRQWRGMFEWLGSPQEFADPCYASLLARYRSKTLIPAIGRMFAGKTRQEIEAEGLKFGVPIAGLSSLEEAIGNEHFAARSSVSVLPLPSGESLRLVDPAIEIDGARAVPNDSGPFVGWEPRRPIAEPPCPLGAVRPLHGLRVLDFGVIVVGAEAGRLFADFGADVIKIENPAFPDGSRQTRGDAVISPGFAAGHRNKRSLAIDLRNEEGCRILLQLAANADVVLSNFKPGTLESLGLGTSDLLQANPRLVIVESSAFGSTGPWSGRGGYGPLVRAAGGLTNLWRYDDDPLSFSDALTVYPDHAAGRISAIAALALLLRRTATGKGGAASISQAEVMLSHLGTLIAGAGYDANNTGSRFVAQCTGDDQWCVIEYLGIGDRDRLAAALGLPDTASEDALTAAIDEKCCALAPATAAQFFQEHGVPAAPMLRVAEMHAHAFFAERDFIRPMRHPFIEEVILVEASTLPGAKLGIPPDNPAPLLGEHSEDVLRDVLGLDDEMIVELLDRKIIFGSPQGYA